MAAGEHMKKIELATWNRREIYEMFSKLDYPFYSVTIPVDVTNVKKVSKEQNLSFYYMMIWICTKAVNQVPAFNMRIRGTDIYELDETIPSFTVMEQGEECFRIITTPFCEDMKQFCEECSKKTKQQRSLFGSETFGDELIYISCTPWFDFCALTNEHSFHKDDTIPRIAWGKYYEENDRLMVHLSVEVNHRTIDGFHLGKLKEAMDQEISNLIV